MVAHERHHRAKAIHHSGQQGTYFTTPDVDAYRARKEQQAAASAPAAGEQDGQGLRAEGQAFLAQLSAAVEDALAYVLQKRAARQAADHGDRQGEGGQGATPEAGPRP